MEIRYIGQFAKHFNQRIKTHPHLTNQFRQRVELFINSPRHPLLKDHPLRGNKEGLRAFSISGDIRVVYFIKGKEIYFLDIGTHNQVY